jgi:hypothetical protein
MKLFKWLAVVAKQSWMVLKFEKFSSASLFRQPPLDFSFKFTSLEKNISVNKAKDAASKE